MFPQYKAMQSIAKFAVAALENVLMLHLNIYNKLCHSESFKMKLRNRYIKIVL